MSEIKLLPCPFCGGEAHIEEHKFWNDITRSFDTKTYGVVCHDCNASSFQFFRIEQDAIQKWNTRKPIEQIVEKLEKLHSHYADLYESTYYDAVDDAIDIVKDIGDVYGFD